MKHFFLFISIWLFLGMAANVNGQTTIIIPDSLGDPGGTGGVEFTPELKAQYESLQELVLTSKSMNTPLPYKVDNSEKKYFRSIFLQKDGSCTQAAGIGYVFTYMVNRARDFAADVDANLYPTHYTYNYHNFGISTGGSEITGWQIISNSGCPSVETYGGMFLYPEDQTKRLRVWMSGYDKYRDALSNRLITDINCIRVQNPDNLIKLKHWFHNHAEGDTVKGGGLVTFSTIVREAIVDTLLLNSGDPGKHIVLSWGTSGTIGHVMTMVGYNDSIKYDFNGDGQFTNPEGNMAEWEIGAVKIANSWGDYWDHGFIYMPYRLFAKRFQNGGIFEQQLNLIKVKEAYNPKVTVRAKIKHASRKRINIQAGIAEDINLTTPTLTQTYHCYALKAGGGYPMKGINEEPIEIELDVSDLLVGVIPANKFFLNIVETGDPNNQYNGEIVEFSIVNYNTPNGIPIITNYSPSALPVVIGNNTTTCIGLKYDYPDEIPEDITLSGHVHLRNKLIIPDGVNVTIADNCDILFEDGVGFDILAGSTLKIGKNVRFYSNGWDNNSVNIYGITNNIDNLSSEININIQDGGLISMAAGNKITLKSNASLIIKKGGNFTLQECATFSQISDGFLEVESGGYLCIHPNGILDVPGHSVFKIRAGTIIPNGYVNPFDIVPPQYIISSENANWAGENYKMVRNLEIENGKSLNLSNTTLQFQNTNGIFINTGSLLDVNSSILTNLQSTCNMNKSWMGISVSGNVELIQTPANQGSLHVNNNTIIENAYTGISSGYDKSIDGDENPGGGIVLANNTIFRNNCQDVVFGTYQSPDNRKNLSRLLDCTFETNNNYYISQLRESIKMSGIDGVRFNNCNFIDNRSDINFNEGGNSRIGILSMNASFDVYNSSFTNLKYGINATSSNSSCKFKTFYSDFSSYRGIYYNGMNYVTIIDNNFDVQPGSSYSATDCSETYGIYVDQSSNFVIENNTFSSTPTEDIICGSFGIIIRNSGDLANELYRNDFTNFTIGIEAIGQNRGNNVDEGLFIHCNRLNNNIYDIFVANDDLNPGNNGIRELHGFSSNPGSTSLSGNLFTNNNSIQISNFENEGNPVSYFHHNVQSTTRVRPDIYNGKLYLYQAQYSFNYNTSCPEKFYLTPYPDLSNEKDEANTILEETEDVLQNLVDNGNTELLSQQVEMTNPSNSYDNYEYLMQTSPYLSESVLTALSTKEDGFNKAMIRDILVENPQAAKSEEVINALDNRADQLPAYMRWQINNGLNNFSEKEILEQFKSYQKLRRDNAMNNIIRGIINEEEGFENTPSLDEIINSIDDIRYQYLLAEMKFNERDFSSGNQILAGISQNYDLSIPEALQKHNDMVSFYNLLSQIDIEEHPNYSGLSEDVLTQLEGFLTASPVIAGKALSILKLNNAIMYAEPIKYPQLDPRSAAQNPAGLYSDPELSNDLQFSLYPNPSKEYVILDWCFETEDMTNEGTIMIYNTTGVLVDVIKIHNSCNQIVLNLANWKSGTYTARISFEKGPVKTIPFVIAN